MILEYIPEFLTGVIMSPPSNSLSLVMSHWVDSLPLDWYLQILAYMTTTPLLPFATTEYEL